MTELNFKLSPVAEEFELVEKETQTDLQFSHIKEEENQNCDKCEWFEKYNIMPTEIIRPNYNSVEEIFKDLKIGSDPELKRILGKPEEYLNKSSLDAERLARYELLQFWDIPNNPKGWNKSLPHWKVEHERLLANQEKHTEADLKPADYDEIKAERDGWVNKFPKPLTPEEVRAKYDEPKGIKLTKAQQEAIDNYQKVKEKLDKWESKFPEMTPDQVAANQGTSSAEVDDLKKQIQRLEALVRSRNSRNTNIDSDHKRETKICEICHQIKNDIFKYSRVVSRDLNTYHTYRICSFCQKIVQMVN